MPEVETLRRASSEEDDTPNQRDNNSGTPNEIPIMIPDWVEGLDSEPKEALDNGSEERETLERDEMVVDRAALEGLNHDVTSIILSHLSVRDIGKAALSSRALAIAVRADGLWELKFRARWNVVPVGHKHWRQCFQAAHDNPHDLWVSHWNVVEPHDTTTAPGRCCIVPKTIPQRTKRHRKQSLRRQTNISPANLSPLCHKCPACRCCDETSHENVGNNWNEMLNRAMQTELEYQQKCLANKDGEEDEADDPILQAERVAAAYAIAPSQCIGDMVNVTSMFTPAKAVLASTQYSVAKWCRNHFLQNSSIDKTKWTATPILGCPRHGESIHAFRAAATFHRPLHVEQYQSSGLQFMIDLLFFNIQPTYDKTHTLSKGTQITEVEQMARDVYGTDRMAEYHQSQSASTSNRGDTNWWKEPCRSNSTVAGLGLDTAHHTWHVVQLTNPDFLKPLSFRVYIQRPECFTVYPSEGFLLPGETQHLTFGVTSFGSLISEAFENLNANREEVNPFLADVYTHEAHLPYAPFAIRYMFAPVIPCVPPMFGARGKPIIPPPPARRGNQTGGRYKPILDHLWDSVATESDVRTLYLSAHVNSNYAFNEFQMATLSPFEVLHKVQLSLQQPPLTMVAPNLQHLYPSVFNQLHNMRLETEVSTSGHSYRTESCTLCDKDWGVRSEEIGRAFVLRKLTCFSHLHKQTRQMKNVVEVIRILSILILNHSSVSAAILKARGSNSFIGQSLEHQILNDDVLVLKRVHQLLYYVHAILLQKRANRLVTKHQRQILRQYELHVEELCIRVQARLIYFGIHAIDPEVTDKLSNHNLLDGLDEFCDYILMTTPWKAVGVHKTTLGTDSIFEPDQSLPAMSLHSLLVDEPEYLDGFRNLLHNPGTYSLGRQEDPNYDHIMVSPRLSNDAAVSKHARQNTHNRYTDLYMNDTTMAFVSALSLVQDPRSLMVHGVYDRVRYPGKVIRRPFLECGVFVRPLPTVRSWREIASPVGRMVNDFIRQQRSLSSELNNEKYTAVINVHTVQLKHCTVKSHICFQLDDIDIEGHQLVHFGGEEAQLQEIRHASSSIKYYLNGIPYPGIGRFPLSGVKSSQDESIVSLNLDLRQESKLSGYGPISCSVLNDHSQRIQNRNLQQEGHVDENLNANMPIPGIGVGPGARLAHLVWFLSAYLGWSVDNQRITGCMILDRRILIAGQWLSNTFMAMPLMLTLIARSASWITTDPLDYHLEGFPFSVDKEMRYFTSHECRYAAFVVIGLWLVMGRYCERHSGRSYERIMTEDIPMNGGIRQKKWLVEKAFLALIVFAQRIWDCTCPLFLQRRVFTPSWNQRSVRELYDHIIHCRSNDLREHRTVFHADNGIGKVRNGKGIKETSSSWKLLIGAVIGIGSFCASSPHFFLNLLTVFYCSIAFGMSMSLQSLEAGRGPANAPTMISRLRPLGLNTLIIAFFLLGQLLGSSGGVQFLAEFVVTTVSLMLGGAASVSTTAVESWLCFFTLSTTSFWGYIFARVGLLNGIRRKRRGSSSTMLSCTIFICACLWIYAIFFWEWELPTAALVVRAGSNAFLSNKESNSAQKQIDQLQ